MNETRGSAQGPAGGNTVSPIMYTRDQDNGYSRTQGDLPVGTNNASPRPPTNGVGAMMDPGVAGGATKAKDGTIAGIGGRTMNYSTAWQIAKTELIYTNGRDYLESNITLSWERNLYHFRNEHGPGTPYVRGDWRRARTFRPKTRSMVKGSEAAHAAAAFSTQDCLVVNPVDATDNTQVLSAAITKELTQHRLETVPWSWFMTAQGAYQDTKVYGVCISHQYWQYERLEEVVPAFDDMGQPILGYDPESGEEVPMGEARWKIITDMPCVDLIAPECMLFDPMCDWRNPAQSSVYLQMMVPMSVGEVLQRMSAKDTKTQQPQWKPYDVQAIIATKPNNADNRTRRAREGHKRIDPTMSHLVDEHGVVWAYFTVVREKGIDICWWSLGTQLILTDPLPLSEVYPHLAPGERPFVIGTSTVEAHRNYPAGDVEQGAPLQEEINQVANQRLDNVRLVLNKRYFIRRGSQMDLDALMRNVPGGGVMTNDPEKDVQVVNTPDVTGSAYQEQDRLSADFDQLAGGFGPQQAQAAGKMVDRAGSLDQIAGAGNAIQDYSIKIFFETWMIPVLRQVVKMIQMYETDQNLLAIAAKKSPLWLRYGMSEVTDELMQQDLVVGINVGIGNTDPVKRTQKFSFGIGQVLQYPGMIQRFKSMEAANEVMGTLGYKDATRFFMDDDELQRHQQTNPPQPPPEVALKSRELDIKQKENEDRDKRETAKMNQDHEFRMQDLQQRSTFDDEKLQHQTGIAAGKNKTMRDIAAAKEGNRLAEVNLKRHDTARQAAEKAKNPPKPPGAGGKGPPK